MRAKFSLRRFAAPAIPVVLVVAALTGCAGPRPVVPPEAQVTAPTAWRTSAGVADVALSATWWEQFGDPGLTRIVTEAIANNDDLKIAAARVEQLVALADLSQAQRGPQVDAGIGIERTRSINPAYGIAQDQTAREPVVMFSFDADLFGRLRQANAASRANLLGGRAAQADVRLLVVSTAARQWFTLRALDARLATLRQTLQAREQTLALIRRRVDTGYASRLDLAQAESEKLATSQQIPAVELAIRRTEDSLCVLLGRTPGAIERDAPDVEPALPVIPAAVPSSLLRRRPDILAAEERLAAADHTLDAARAAFMPDLRISGSYGQVTSTLLRNPIDVFSLGASVLAPIFDSGRLKAQQGATAAVRDEAAFAYRKTALTAFSQVEDALSATQRLREQIDLLQAQKATQQEALRIAASRYRAGYAPFLDQLDAQRNLLAVELAISQLRADELNAYVSLFQTLGGGWDSTQIADRTPG